MAPAQAEAPKDTRTVFVRGVSFDVDDQPFEELFSNVGPVKQCFLVRQKGEAKHKGMGFVTFALPEDAQRAIEDLNGSLLGGRKLQIELANKRATFEERKRKFKETLGMRAAAEGTEDQPAAAAPATKAKQAAKQPATQPSAQKDDNSDEQTKPVHQKHQKAAAGKAAMGAAGAPTQGKHRNMCTVALGGLTPELVPAALKLAQQAGTVADVVNPAPAEVVSKAHLTADGCSGTVLLVVYSNVQEAMTAVTKLHGKQLSASQGDANGQGKKRKRKLDNDGSTEPQPNSAAAAGTQAAALAAPCVLWARQLVGEGAHVRRWRVIVRNLPFKVNESELRKLLSSAGFVWELTLPRGPDGRFKGFAFAAYTLRAHADKAVATINGKEIGKRPMAVDMAVAKSQYESGKDGTAHAHQNDPDFMHDADEGREAADDAAGAGKAAAAQERSKPSAEDKAAGSKGEEDGYQLDSEDGASDSELGDDDEEGEGEEASDFSDDDEDLSGGEEEAEGEEEGDGASDEGEGEEDAEVQKEHQLMQQVMAGLIGADEHVEPHVKSSTQQEGANHHASEEKAAGKQPGKKTHEGLDSAVERKGDRTGQPASGSSALKTTVFVRGLPLDITKVALQAKMESYGPVKSCRLVVDKSTGKGKGTAFVEFQTEQGAQKAAAACARGRQSKGPGVIVSGRTLDVDLAVPQEEARKLAAKGGEPGSRDKRNLYLAKEGEIKEGSAAWNSMSQHDREKRLRGAEEKRTKLASPNFVISATRLSVRNIPYSMTETKLRSLAVKAVKERASKEAPEVLQVKILRDDERLGPDGKPKSKGMGFIEFSKHDHAVACLRQLNNNPDVFTHDRRPIVEFAIENVKALKKLEAIQARRTAALKSNNAGKAAVDTAGEDGHAASPHDNHSNDDGVDMAALSPHQRKKLKAKLKMQRRKARKQEQGADKAGAGDGNAAAAQQQQQSEAGQSGQQQGPGKEGVVSKRQARRDRKARSAAKAAEAGRDTTQTDDANKKKVNNKQRQGRQQSTELQQPKQEVSKRRREDDELDAAADAALMERYAGGRVNGKRRKKDNERHDKFDKLAEQYTRKLSGEAPASKQQRQKQQQVHKKSKQGAGVQASKPVATLPALNLKSDNLKRWFD